MCLPRRLTWLQAGGTTTTCSYFLETKAAADRPKAQPKAHIYLLRLWEKLGGRSSLTAWQQRSDIGCQASRITCAAPGEHLTPATGARLQCPRVQDNCTNRLLLCRGAMRSCCRVRRTHGLRWSAAQPALLYLAHPSPPTDACSACLCQHTNPLWWWSSRFVSLKCIIHSTPPSSRAERKLAEPQTLPGSRKAVVQVRIPGACHCHTLLALWQAYKEIRMRVAL